MNWIPPIVDRVPQDVEFLKRFARRIRNTGWENTSQEDKDRWLFGNIDTLFTVNQNRVITSIGESIKLGTGNIKGAINTWDIFRMSSNLEYLGDFLNTYRGKSYPIFTPINPPQNGFMPLTDINSIRDYVESIKSYDVVFDSTPTVTYSTRPDVFDVNDIEQIELDIYKNARSVFNEFWLDVGVWDDELIWHDLPIDTVCVFCGVWNDVGIWNDRQNWQD